MYKTRYEQIKEEKARINLDNFKELVVDYLDDLIEEIEDYVIEEIIDSRLKTEFKDCIVRNKFEEIEDLFYERDDDDDDDYYEPLSKTKRLKVLLIIIDEFEQVLLDIINDLLNRTLIWIDINANNTIRPYLKAFDSLRAINSIISEFFYGKSRTEVDYKLLYLVLVELETNEN